VGVDQRPHGAVKNDDAARKQLTQAMMDGLRHRGPGTSSKATDTAAPDEAAVVRRTTTPSR
jgi:hypothetical protein